MSGFCRNSGRISSVYRLHIFFHADLAHLVERHLAKVEVASSSLVIRSTRRRGNIFGVYEIPRVFSWDFFLSELS